MFGNVGQPAFIRVKIDDGVRYLNIDHIVEIVADLKLESVTIYMDNLTRDEWYVTDADSLARIKRLLTASEFK
jgi:hypothetical protein